MNYRFISYATEGRYAEEARLLKECLDFLKIPHDIEILPSAGSWVGNCAKKATVVQKMLLKYPGERLVWCDVDSIVMRRPDLLGEIDADIAAVMYPEGPTLLSGVVLFNNTMVTGECVDSWVQLCVKNPNVWDQKNLHRAILNKAARIKFVALPPEYNYMPAGMSDKHFPGVNPVILATRASLRWGQE